MGQSRETQKLIDANAIYKMRRLIAAKLNSFTVVSGYKPSHSILNFFELILKAYSQRIPNRTAIFQDWADQSFVCCLFYLLWTSVKISSQEAKGPISLSTNIADMCIPSIIVTQRYLILSTLSRTVPSRVYEAWIFLIFVSFTGNKKTSPIQLRNDTIIEPRHDKMCLREFPTRPDTNRPAQPQKLARVLKFRL